MIFLNKTMKSRVSSTAALIVVLVTLLLTTTLVLRNDIKRFFNPIVDEIFIVSTLLKPLIFHYENMSRQLELVSYGVYLDNNSDETSDTNDMNNTSIGHDRAHKTEEIMEQLNQKIFAPLSSYGVYLDNNSDETNDANDMNNTSIGHDRAHKTEETTGQLDPKFFTPVHKRMMVMEIAYYNNLALVKKQIAAIKTLFDREEVEHSFFSKSRRQEILPAYKAMLQAINAAIVKFEEHDQKIFELAYAENIFAANKVFDQEIRTPYVEGAALALEFNLTIKRLIDNYKTDFDDYLNMIILLFIAVCVLLIVLVFALAFLQTKSITQGIQQIIDYMNDTERARTNLRGFAPAPCQDREDEVGALACAINNYMLAENRTKKLCEDIMMKMQTFFSAVNNSSQAVNEISQSMQQQFNSTKNLSKMTDKSQSSIDNAVNSVNNSLVSATTLFDTIQSGQSTVDELGKGISEIYELSNRVQDITVSIGNIANQTNMLAINAAIESARAGEYGRGFGVVAERVVKLAENAGVLSREIVTIGGDITNSINLSAERTENLRTSLDQIFQSSKDNEQVVSMVNATLKTQRGLHEGIREATNELKQIGLSTSTTSEEIANSMEELSNSAREAHNMLNRSVSGRA